MIENEILAALISAVSTLLSTIITCCYSLVIAFFVYFIFRLIVNKQDSRLDMQLERAKASIIPAQNDLYKGTRDFVKFLRHFKTTVEVFQFIDPTRKLIIAYVGLVINNGIDRKGLELSEGQINYLLENYEFLFYTLYHLITPSENFNETILEYEHELNDNLNNLLIIPEIKDKGKLLFKTISEIKISEEYHCYLSFLKSIPTNEKHELLSFETISNAYLKVMEPINSIYEDIESTFNSMYEVL